jgi:predicted hotdog family 3-hydroxylacyl-ACP dehydratase
VNKTLDPALLLPHRAPMILLSDVIDCDDTGATAHVHITSASLFFDADMNGVPAWVGLEYMAQTIGIWAGQQQRARGQIVQPGFLLGCRRYDCNAAVFPSGSTLHVCAVSVYRDDSGLGAFDCRISSATLEATAQIKAFLPDNPRAFVRPFSHQATSDTTASDTTTSDTTTSGTAT